MKSLVTNAFPTWEFGADSHILKLQHLQNIPPHH